MMQPPLHPGDDGVLSPNISSTTNKDAETPRVVQASQIDLPSEPPSKRLKTDDPTLLKKPWKLRAVLGDAARSPVPLVPALAAQILDKKQTSKLIRKLNEVLPIGCLQHLKRVKSCKEGDQNMILLLLWSLDSATCDIDSALVLKQLTEAGVDTTAFSNTFRRQQVAKFAPLTRSQFEALKRHPAYWPCNFHEDKYFESLVTSSHELWSEENRDLQDKYMRLALRHEEDSDDRRGGGVVVDPSTNTIIAEGHGTRGHPLHHTVLNLVDLVARSQGGGALPHTLSMPSLTFRAGSVPPLDDKEEEGDRPTTSHNHLKRFGSIAQLSSVPKTGPYLCTGYDVYLACEPCHFCSMALIHMRTRRVFYSRPSRDGALGSADKIHTLEGLNHRYEVYSGVLYQDNINIVDCS